jgi:hypothetical protein
MRVLFCESCGAPLDAPWTEIVIVCPHCSTQNTPGRVSGQVISSAPNDGRPRINLNGRTYVLEGRLAVGDSANVYKARWAMRLGEAVVIKVQRAETDSDLLRREYEALKPIAIGTRTITGRDRLVTAYAWRSGFQLSLATLHGQHATQGLPGRVLVWVYKRLLEQMVWMHRNGAVHNAVTPDHILVHPKNHGAMMVGFTLAGEVGETVRGEVQSWRGAFNAAPPSGTPSRDIAMAAWSILWASGAGFGSKQTTLSPTFHAALVRAANGHYSDAQSHLSQVITSAKHDYGSGKYSPIDIDGWV